jgi:hypothetical protein
LDLQKQANKKEAYIASFLFIKIILLSEILTGEGFSQSPPFSVLKTVVMKVVHLRFLLIHPEQIPAYL